MIINGGSPVMEKYGKSNNYKWMMNRGTPMTLETSIYPSDPSIPFEGFYRTFPRKAVTIGYTIFPNFDSSPTSM